MNNKMFPKRTGLPDMQGPDETLWWEPILNFLPAADSKGLNSWGPFPIQNSVHPISQNISCIVLKHSESIQKLLWFIHFLSLVLGCWLGKCYCGITHVLWLKLFWVFNSPLLDLGWHKLKQNLASSTSHILKINLWNMASSPFSSDIEAIQG